MATLRFKNADGVAVRKLYLYNGDASDVGTAPVIDASKASRLLGANVAASAAITGTTETDTAFDKSVSIPANSLNAGSVIRFRCQGIYTATTGAETHTIAVKLGSTVIASVALVDPANDDLFYFDGVIVIRTVGASGTMVATGTLLAQAASGAGTAKPWFLASTAVDTTAALTLACFIDRQAAATDSDSARLDVITVEVLG